MKLCCLWHGVFLSYFIMLHIDCGDLWSLMQVVIGRDVSEAERKKLGFVASPEAAAEAARDACMRAMTAYRRKTPM